MGEPFIGEIRMFGFNFAPKKWAKCDGGLLPCEQNMALYALIGTTFGGDGVNDFALPDLRGRAPLHAGASLGSYYVRGDYGGLEAVPLAESQLPVHNHTAAGTSVVADKPTGGPTRALATAQDPNDPVYRDPSSLTAMHAGVISPAAGGGHPHNNMQPIQVINFCISLDGQFPPRS